MTFTDDELNDLKRRLETVTHSIGPRTVKALIERLEAAEACIEDAENDHMGAIGGRCLDAWRKAAGK